MQCLQQYSLWEKYVFSAFWLENRFSFLCQGVGLISCDALVTLLNILSFSARVKNVLVDLVGQLVLQIQGNQWVPGDRDSIFRFTFFEREPCINSSLFSLKGPRKYNMLSYRCTLSSSSTFQASNTNWALQQKML